MDATARSFSSAAAFFGEQPVQLRLEALPDLVLFLPGLGFGFGPDVGYAPVGLGLEVLAQPAGSGRGGQLFAHLLAYAVQPAPEARKQFGLPLLAYRDAGEQRVRLQFLKFFALGLLPVLRERKLQLLLRQALVFGARQLAQHGLLQGQIPAGDLFGLPPGAELAQLAEYRYAVFQLAHPVQEPALIKADP